MKIHWKKLLIMIIVIVVIKSFFALEYVTEQGQSMNQLDYYVTVNDNGSMTVTETWDIYISHTNTIFKNFDKSEKFGDIIDVSVKDLKTGKQLTRIYQEMYHVTTDCFYAQDISGNKFEIAWGTGMENKIGNKKYQITYTVTDVIKSYYNCQELYWMFLSDENNISCDNVTGTIVFPHSVSDINNLKAWGHGPLNGNINIADNNKIEFNINGLKSGRMLETRVISTEKIIKDVNGSFTPYNYLNYAIEEETRWADEANNQSKEFWSFIKGALLIFGSVYLVVLIINIIKIVKYKRIYKEKAKSYSKEDLEYYRDIPRDGVSTPMEAEYMYYFNKQLKEGGSYQSNGVAAVILNLALKKYISLRCEDNNTYVKIIKDDDGLKNDEKAIYKLLKNTGKKDEFEISTLNDYAKKHYYDYSSIINRMVNQAREQLYYEKLVDKAEKRMYEKSKNADGSYELIKGTFEFVVLWGLISALPLVNKLSIIPAKYIFITIAIFLPLGIASMIKYKTLGKIQNKIAVLTEKGYIENQQWKGLAKFLENFSTLDEATVPDLALWEKYLVFATAFGIAEKVIEQMKAKYPNVFVEEYWSDEVKNTYPLLNYSLYSGIYHTEYDYSPINSISSNAGHAYHTSVREIAAHASSSGSGGGGGFSGGGGGRRRWRRNGRKIVPSKASKQWS